MTRQEEMSENELDENGEDADGFTPLGLELSNISHYDGFNGLAKMLEKHGIMLKTIREWKNEDKKEKTR